MEKKLLITEEMLLNAGFKELESLTQLNKKELFKQYGITDYKVFRMWTDDEHPLKLDIDNAINNSGRQWHLHIDNSDCETIGCADIDYAWQFNKLMEVFESDFRL